MAEGHEPHPLIVVAGMFSMLAFPAIVAAELRSRKRSRTAVLTSFLRG